MTPSDRPEPTAVCVGGGPVDEDGVCVEHGETACVISLPPSDDRD